MDELIVNNKQKLLLIIITIVLPVFGYYLGVQNNSCAINNQDVVVPCNCENLNDDADKSSEQYYYEVAGAVKSPGVFSTESEILVQQAIENAGGFSDKADMAYVNRSIHLANSVIPKEKIYIPEIGETPSQYYSELIDDVVNNKLNLNTATIAQLDTIPGVGEVTAKKIIAARPFKNCQAVNDIEGVNKTVKQDLLERCQL